MMRINDDRIEESLDLGRNHAAAADSRYHPAFGGSSFSAAGATDR
jgi:hypothetical protein